MVTRKKKELDIEIPSVSTKLKLSKPSVDKPIAKQESINDVSGLQNQLVEMNTKLDKLNEMIYSSDWKLWKIMTMIEMIAKENGYAFAVRGDAEQQDFIEKDKN
jgi:hypothetical protein